MATKLTVDKDGKSQTLLDCIESGKDKYFNVIIWEGFGKIDWENLNSDCYKHTLHINSTLIKNLTAEGKEEAAAKVAISSIRGLAAYRLEDHKRVPGNESLLQMAILELKKQIPKNPKLHADIQKLIDDPDVQKIPGVCEELKQELEKVKGLSQSYTFFKQAASLKRAASNYNSHVIFLYLA